MPKEDFSSWHLTSAGREELNFLGPFQFHERPPTIQQGRHVFLEILDDVEDGGSPDRDRFENAFSRSTSPDLWRKVNLDLRHRNLIEKNPGARWQPQKRN